MELTPCTFLRVFGLDTDEPGVETKMVRHRSPEYDLQELLRRGQFDTYQRGHGRPCPMGLKRSEGNKMGTAYGYECSACGYEAVACPGLSIGMRDVIRTMVCLDCSELVGVPVGACGREGPTGDPELDQELGKCPECSGMNLEEWPKNKPCPKCGRKMEAQSVIEWD